MDTKVVTNQKIVITKDGYKVPINELTDEEWLEYEKKNEKHPEPAWD